MEASELLGSATPMASDLQEGVRTIALDQTVRFKLYARVVLPADGYVFWVRAPLIKQKPFQPASPLVSVPELAEEEMEPCEIEAKCSLHYSTDTRQEEGENYSANRVVMTTQEEVQDLNDVASNMAWIGEFAGMRFAFSSQTNRYRQAGLWHYSGFAVYADMLPQIIDRAQDFSQELIVSNSLPAWLAIQAYNPRWAFWKPLPPLFPSFLLPDNEPPPFAAVHIVPEGTRALASAPTIDRATQSHTQLCADAVRITLWGASNAQALDFVDAVYRYSLDTGAIGIMNTPAIRDEKRTQSELGIIAKKKTVEFEVSYLQHRMNDVARKVILKAAPGLYVDHRKVSPLP